MFPSELVTPPVYSYDTPVFNIYRYHCMPDSGESTDHTQTIKSGLPYHIPYHFRALKRPCPAVSNHVQPCPTMSGHVWTQVDMLIDPASGLKKSNWFAYHFRIPLYHTSAKRIKTTPYTSMIPANVEHWGKLASSDAD